MLVDEPCLRAPTCLLIIAQAGTYEFDGTNMTYHPTTRLVEGTLAEDTFVIVQVTFDGNDKATLVTRNGGRMTFTRVE